MQRKKKRMREDQTCNPEAVAPGNEKTRLDTPVFTARVSRRALYNECVQLGYIKKETNFEECTFWSAIERDFDTREFTREALMEIQSDLNIHINFLSNRNILTGNYVKALPIFQKIADDYPWQVIARYCVWRCLVGLNHIDMAKKELEEIRYLVKNNDISSRLYNKYKPFMSIDC